MRSVNRHASRSSLGLRTFLVPVAWIVALLASYLLLADWQTVPALVSSAIAAI